MYKVKYKRGEILIEFSAYAGAVKAQLVDSANGLEEIIVGANEDETYDKCLSWASSNIVGAFEFERLSLINKARTD